MNPWDNPVPAPSYGAAPRVDFSQLASLLPQQQQQRQPQPGQPNAPLNLNPNAPNAQQPFNPITNQNPNGLAARLMAYLNPPVNAGNQGGTGGNLITPQNGGIY
jgi:hypothetical protein